MLSSLLPRKDRLFSLSTRKFSTAESSTSRPSNHAEVDASFRLQRHQQRRGVAVGPAPSSKDHYTVVISVSDTGAGISTENQSRLFNQYVQFNASVLQKGKGSGLGLWISKGL